ncbi:SRCR domain-containing protein [Mycena venus]|uniref:SRCR domain-containing protein n=1 Tax=Mycena venus TaxID=2733690 RepID=A0A8H7DGP8_9AGAR|nr:SRCR domain-containing protein [Mycena venus]
MIWTERVEKLTLGGYDQVLAISERSLRELFFSYYRQGLKGKVLYHCFTHWKSDLFSAHFEAIDLRLLSNDRAIVWVNIHNGELAIEFRTEHKDFWTYIGFKKATSTQKTIKREFSEVSIAFEVELKVVEHKELSAGTSWQQSVFENSYLDRCHHSARASRAYKHLILDFQNAKHIPALSNTAGLHVTYQVVTKTKVTLETCRHTIKDSDGPVILILGMCGFRSMPTVRLQWFSGWVLSGQKSLGSICLSREMFLEGRLLKLLALVNKKTTIVPEWAGIVNGDWDYELTILEKHSRRQNERGSWKFFGRTDKSLDYIWDHHDEWKHDSKHDGFSGEEKHGEYSVSCRTKNKLSIPTYFRQGCLEVTIQGESTLKIAKKQDGLPSWSKKTSAKWSASIEVHSRADGLHIEVVGGQMPVFADVESEGECSMDVLNAHMKQFPSKIDLHDAIHDLKDLLQGTWDYSYPGMGAYALSSPIFTRHGDLIVELSAFSSPSNGITSNGTNIFIATKNKISNAVTHSLLSSSEQLTSASSTDTLTTPLREKTVLEMPVSTKAPPQPTPPMTVKSNGTASEKNGVSNGQKSANGNGFPAAAA